MTSSGPSFQTTHRPKGVQCSRCSLQPKRALILETSAQIIAGALSISCLKGGHRNLDRYRLGKRIVHLTTVRAAFSDGDLRRSAVRQSRETFRVGRRRGGTDEPGQVLLLQSALYSKQVITRTSGRKLGVVSQLWVDSVKWDVVALSVKPSLVYGEEDTILLSSLRQVGDVLLVHDEAAIEENFSLFGYYNIVGSEIVTENGVYLGKVRDYKFDPEDGAIATLVFDGLGLFIVPDTVVSTYAMGMGEVLSAGPDRIIVRDSTASRVRRLSMGRHCWYGGHLTRLGMQSTRNGILEKLSLAEPPWKQDDVLYSNYPASRPDGRPPPYRSSQQGRPEGRTGASAGAPAYMRAPEYEPRRPSAYEPPGTAAYKDPRMPAYERAAERPRREATNPGRKREVTNRAESETFGSQEASFREPRQMNRGYPAGRERAFAGARSPVASERRASEVVRNGTSEQRVRGQEAVPVQRRASSGRDTSPGPPRETGVRRDASRPQEAGDSERGLEWSAAVQVSGGPEAEPIYAERGFLEGAERSRGLFRGSRFERARPEAGANLKEPAFVEREPAREPALGPATVGSSFGVQNSGANQPPEGRNGFSSPSVRESTGFRGEPARATAGTSSETSALRGVNRLKNAERLAGSEGAGDGSVNLGDKGVTELRESRFGEERRAALMPYERAALERPGVRRPGAPSDIREASPQGDAATRGGRFTGRDDWERRSTGGDSDRSRGFVRRDAEREFGPLGRAAGREGDPTEWISDSGRGSEDADRQSGFAGRDSDGVQGRMDGDTFAVGEAASYSDQMRSFPSRARDVGSISPPRRAGTGDGSSGASGSFSRRPEKAAGQEEPAGDYGRDPNRPVAPGSRSQVGSARERPLQGSTPRYGSVARGSEQRLPSRDVAGRIPLAERPGSENNIKRDPGNGTAFGRARRAAVTGSVNESRMSGIPLGQSVQIEDSARQLGRPPLPRESRGQSVERVPGMESAASVLDEDELTLGGSQQIPARARPFRERVERGSSSEGSK